MTQRWRQVVALDQGFQLAARAAAGRLATDQQANEVQVAELGHGLQQQGLAFAPLQPARQHDHRQAVGQAPVVDALDQALVGHGLRAEGPDVDAAPDQPHPRRVDRMVRAQIVGDEVRGRDDPLTLGQHRVVAPLQRIAAGIGDVHRGHEVAAAALGRGQGAPARRPGAGVHDVDFVTLDDVHQPLDVVVDRGRVAAGQGHDLVHRPGPGEAVFQGAPGRGDDGRPAGGGQSLGDIDGGALKPAVL